MEFFTDDEETDSDGCNKKLRKHFEDRCDEVYEKVNDEAQMIEDDEERKEAVCWWVNEIAVTFQL